MAGDHAHALVDARDDVVGLAELQEGDDFSSVSDPPAWHYPVRRDLAAALLAKGDVAGARKEAQGALKYRPKDPGTLALLSTLEARTAAR